MKVLYINTTYYNGGSTGKIISSLCEEMRQNGNEPYLLYGVSNGEKKEDGAYLIEKKIYKKINGLKAKIIGNHGFNNSIATQKAIEIIESIRPDIVHLHNLHGSYINVEMLINYLKEIKVPIVWTLHDCWSFTGRCAYYDYNSCYKWREGCFRCDFRSKYPNTWFVDNARYYYQFKKELYGNCANIRFVTPSMWLKNEMKQSFLRDRDIRVINNGIDLNVFKPKVSKKSGYTRKIALAVAYRWSKEKGYDYLKMIAKEMGNDWKMVVIGGDKKQQEDLRKNGIIAINKVLNDMELAEWYSIADVFINPTLEDNFPTVLIEAMACGTPCITFDTGGCSEIVGNMGIIVEKHDWKEMLNCIETARRNISRMDCACRAQTNFNNSRMNQEYIKLYKCLYSTN